MPKCFQGTNSLLLRSSTSKRAGRVQGLLHAATDLNARTHGQVDRAQPSFAGLAAIAIIITLTSFCNRPVLSAPAACSQRLTGPSTCVCGTCVWACRDNHGSQWLLLACATKKLGSVIRRVKWWNRLHASKQRRIEDRMWRTLTTRGWISLCVYGASVRYEPEDEETTARSPARELGRPGKGHVSHL
jgi:hypothetical protein